MIYPLSEGVFTIGHDKIFHPFNPSADELNERPTGSLLVEVQPFLVITKNDVIVLDTGLGFHEENGILQLHHNIQSCGYEPSQVTKVLLSHLHKDHAGGATYKDERGIFKPSFDNATYFIYRNEADYALQIGYPSYIPEEIEPLFSSGQVEWLEGEEGTIGNDIHYTHSGGHCPEHIVFLIADGSEKIFFGGDEAPQLKQMKMKYVAKYDHDGKKAMMLREEYAERGRKEGWQFLFYHDVGKPTAVLSS
ncbi:MAG TPA: MBL fold metallo-hydrolase [Flavipsychrobacter sp.]|nr:MBL fold metallo-hydrolase [Flavipsychrobacter sp.]